MQFLVERADAIAELSIITNHLVDKFLHIILFNLG